MNLPTIPKGSSAGAVHARRMMQAAREGQVIRAPGVLVSRTARGTFVRARGGVAQSVTQSSGMQWRGDWNSSLSYAVNDVVRIIDGPATGTYICTTAIGANAASGNPDAGTYWAALMANNARGVWL